MTQSVGQGPLFCIFYETRIKVNALILLKQNETILKVKSLYLISSKNKGTTMLRMTNHWPNVSNIINSLKKQKKGQNPNADNKNSKEKLCAILSVAGLPLYLIFLILTAFHAQLPHYTRRPKFDVGVTCHWWLFHGASSHHLGLSNWMRVVVTSLSPHVCISSDCVYTQNLRMPLPFPVRWGGRLRAASAQRHFPEPRWARCGAPLVPGSAPRRPASRSWLGWPVG